MKTLRNIIITIAAMLGVAALPVALVSAANNCSDAVSCIQSGSDGVNSKGSGSADELPDRIKTIVNIMLFLLGAIAVIMIIIGGIRYTTSNGDASSVKGAKDTILYAVIGLVVAILAYAIVNFVLGAFK